MLYLVFGPTIIVLLCTAAFCYGMPNVVGGMLVIFGVATLVLSFFARATGLMRKRNVIAIGVGAVVAGMVFLTVL